MEFFSPAQENKRPAVALQLEFFSPLQFGLFQSYEVEWKTCRVELQLGLFSPAQENKRPAGALQLGLFSPLQFGLFLVL